MSNTVVLTGFYREVLCMVGNSMPEHISSFLGDFKEKVKAHELYTKGVSELQRGMSVVLDGEGRFFILIFRYSSSVCHRIKNKMPLMQRGCNYL